MTDGTTQPIPVIENAIRGYGELNKMSRWYPSDMEPVTRKQKIFMNNLGIDWRQIKSARKAEMEIEDKAIKLAIDKYLSKHHFTGIMEI